jgi:uncharacterized metal-binding protein YceD (DUF177 family)
MADPLSGEFSRPIALVELTQEPVRRVLSATKPECKALAKRFGLPKLLSLEGEIYVRGNFGGEVEVSGKLTASVEQICVVTLESFSSTLAENFVLRFAREVPEEEREENSWSDDDEDPPEPIAGEYLDLGEILAQQLGLAIDPFPRRPGADFDPALLTDPKESASPFAALASIKKKRPN